MRNTAVALLGPCGWHDAMPYNSPASLTPYAIIPYGASDAAGINPATGCAKGGQSPNANDADATINIVSHEQSEAITDPDASAWLSKAGNEVGDLCAWQYGRPLGGPGGAEYNQVIAGDHYWLQGEWSNASSSCRWGANAPRPCRTGQLAITLGHTSAGLGHEGIAIVFHSRSSTCTIRGFPTVIGVTSHGHDVSRAQQSRRGYLAGTVPVSTVTVSIGHPASAFAEGLDPVFCTGSNHRRLPTVHAPVCRPSENHARSSAPPSGHRRFTLVVLRPVDPSGHLGRDGTPAASLTRARHANANSLHSGQHGLAVTIVVASPAAGRLLLCGVGSLPPATPSGTLFGDDRTPGAQARLGDGGRPHDVFRGEPIFAARFR